MSGDRNMNDKMEHSEHSSLHNPNPPTFPQIPDLLLPTSDNEAVWCGLTLQSKSAIIVDTTGKKVCRTGRDGDGAILLIYANFSHQRERQWPG